MIPYPDAPRSETSDGSFEERFRAADGLFTVDQDQRITSWNSSAERMLGRTAADVVGRKCWEVFGNGGFQKVAPCQRECQPVRNARHGRPTPGFDLTLPFNGQEKTVGVSLVLEPWARRRFQLIHLLRDITISRRVNLATAAADETAQAGDKWSQSFPVTLSKREKEALRLLAAGMSTLEIANVLGVRPLTARNHVTRLMGKLGARTRLQAVLRGARLGLVPASSSS
jgi:PAS domain S-box-containing protein